MKHFWLLSLLGFLLPVAAAFARSGDDISAQSLKAAKMERTGEHQPGRHQEAGHFIGLPIRSPEGKDWGEVVNLAIDWQRGRVAYAIVSLGGYFGGALDIEDKRFAIPVKVLTYVPDDQEAIEAHLLLKMERDAIQAADGFDQYDWPDMEDPQWAEEVHRRYGQLAEWEAQAEQKEADSEVERATAQYLQSQSTGSLQKATDLVGLEVRDIDGDEIGDVEALQIDWPAGEVVHAVVPFGGLLGLGEERAEIPLEAMTLTARDASAPLRFSSDHYLKLDIDKETLEEQGGYR